MKKFFAAATVAATLFAMTQAATAGTSSTTIFPDQSIFETFATQPFDPIDPSAQTIELRVTGTWTFDFAHAPSSEPYTGGLYFGPADLVFYFATPHSNDGTSQFNTQVDNVVYLENFTGTAEYVVKVDKTTVIPKGSLQNFVGPGPGAMYIESALANWLPFGDPGSIYLADGSVKGLTVMLTSVPEPASCMLLFSGLCTLVAAKRRA